MCYRFFVDKYLPLKQIIYHKIPKTNFILIFVEILTIP